MNRLTHSLHRIGTYEDLKTDYVILACLAKNLNRETQEGRKGLIKIARILKKNSPINIIPEFTWNISPVVTAVYDNIETVKGIVKTLKEEDIGISIVVSGLISEIKQAVEEIGLHMHTVHFSLGTFGKKELLPDKKVLEISTMCGHHCISPQSIRYYSELIKKEKITVEKAARKLAKPCVCGIFNINRAISILEQMK
ncbi:MAG: hypothetical protein ACFFCL_07485 [Promethearchaeota archaeon]